jgi:hypothetical protein
MLARTPTPATKTPARSSGLASIICNHCGKPGHKKIACPKLKKSAPMKLKRKEANALHEDDAEEKEEYI